MCGSREFEHAMQLIYCQPWFSQGRSLKPFTGRSRVQGTGER